MRYSFEHLVCGLQLAAYQLKEEHKSVRLPWDDDKEDVVVVVFIGDCLRREVELGSK